MHTQMLKSKIQELQVTESSINYPGSISLPEELMKAARIRPFELVHVNNKSNGNRIQTYAVKSSEKGRVTLNGAASKLFSKGDTIHVLSYALLNEQEAEDHEPILVLASSSNLLIQASPYEFQAESNAID